MNFRRERSKNVRPEHHCGTPADQKTVVKIVSLDELATTIRALPIAPDRHARVVALSGIDASGKGHIARRLADILGRAGLRVALLNVDGWLTLPDVRFGREDPGRHFYLHAFRFGEMFSTLVDPLARTGEVALVADYTEETATDYRKYTYSYDHINTVLLEGIFLFRRDLRPRYDFAVWIDCSFETALQRAVARGQEGLSPEQTVAAFETVYFPAQRLHFAVDCPRESADFVFINDDRVRNLRAA